MPTCPRCRTQYPAGHTHCDYDGELLAHDSGYGFDLDFASSTSGQTKAESPSGRRVVSDDQILGEVSAPRPGGPTVAEVGTRVSAVTGPPPPRAEQPPRSSSRTDRRREAVRIQAEGRVGEVLGSYRLQGVLGAGGMGAVYRAEHITLGRPVALKLLHPQFARRRDAVARFFQEAKAVNRIRHKNIVDVTDLVKLDDGTVFIIMELLEGISLGAYLRETGLLSVTDTISVVIQICDALSAAHAQHIVHRDLKPDNIFLTRTDEGDLLVKLLDFGVAKLVGQDEQVGHKTAAGSVVGTPAFMSPEQAGALQIDHRSDIYSLGAIMYQLFTGQHVFRGRTFGDYVDAHLNEQPAPARTTPCGVRVDEELESIIMRCLQKSPSARYQTGGELREALIAYMELLAADLGTQIESESGIYRLSGVQPGATSRPLVGATEVMWPVGSEPGPPPSQPETDAPLHLPAGPAIDTAMAVGDIPGTFVTGRSTRMLLWLGAVALVGSGLVVALVMAAGEDEASDKAAAPAELDAGAGGSLPMVAPMLGPDAAVRITTRIESSPPAEVFPGGSSAARCTTPCELTIDPRDGGSPVRRDFVLRAPGYREATVTVSLTAPAPTYTARLEPEKVRDAGPDRADPDGERDRSEERGSRADRDKKRRDRDKRRRDRAKKRKDGDSKGSGKKRTGGQKSGGKGSDVLSPSETLDPFGRKK